jgi:hypothetical protein
MSKENITQSEQEDKQKDQLIVDFPFFITPNSIIDVEGVFTANEKLVYLTLCRFGNLGREAFPSLNKLVAKCELSKPTIIKAIKGLIEKGALIKRSVKNDKGSYDRNIYNVIYEFPVAEVVKEVYGGSKGALPGVVKEVYPINNDLINKKDLKESTTQPEKEPARSHSFLNDEKQKTVFKESLSLYCELYKQQLDIKPALNKGKDHKLIKQLLSEYGAEAVQFAIKEHLTNPDEWTRRGGCTIPQLKHNFPGYLLKYKKHQEEAEREQREREAKRLRIEQMRQEEEKERQEKLRRAALTPEQRKLEDMETSMNLLKAKIEMRETLVEMKNGDNEQITKLREHQNQLQQLENEYNELVQAVAV